MERMKKVLAVMLVLFMLVQASPVTLVVFAADDRQYTYDDTYNSGKRDQVATTLNGTSANAYYTGSYAYDSLSKQSASSIQSALKTLMTSTHKKISSYNNCRDMADQTDCENEDGRVSLIYTQYSATMSQYNGWNREHVWPQSLGGGNTSGGGADLHHIRPSDAVVNSTRGNKKYGNADGGKSVYGSNPASGMLGGTSGTYFEPNDNVKGDVARICLYVYVRWGSAWGADSITEVFQSVDVLLDWCEMDPVDTWELGRNEVVEAYQGNRNVFIDYPEYAWLIFGEAVPTNMSTPSGKASSGTTTPPTTEPQPTEPVVKPTEPQPTEPATPSVDSFKSVMSQLTLNISADEETFALLTDALQIYGELSENDKQSVVTQYELLKNSIIAYNGAADALNQDTEAASAQFTFYIRPSSTSLLYIAYLLPEKVHL